MSSSRIPGFYRLAPEARRTAALAAADLPETLAGAWAPEALALPRADAMIENVIGHFALPNGVAVNLRLNGEDRLVPMVVEEPSVVAAVANMSRIAREGGGFMGDADASLMIGQVQVSSPAPGAADRVRAAIPRLSAMCHGVHAELERLGGGLRGMEVREVVYDEPGYPREEMLVLHVLLDCRDAMGANMVNTLAELLAPEVVSLTGGRQGLRILSNLADRRLARARVRLHPAAFGAHGADVIEGIAAAYRFAYADPYRAATHNKGIMNGIDAVAIATGNDWRAIEAGAHAYAARSGQYRPLTAWRIDAEGCLVGTIELPMQVGTVGGPIRVHPTVQANLRLAGVQGAQDLAVLIAAVGLAQNMGALRALAMEGIQRGHMRMHARTVALDAGAQGDELPRLVDALVAAHDFTVPRARELLAGIRSA
jgi:hydroxymethylglutaryl-CoA reductase